MKKTKKFFGQKYFWILVVLVAAAFVLKVFLPDPTASLVLHYQGGQMRKFSGEVVDHMTILEAIQASSQGANFNFQYKPNYLSIDGRSKDIKIELNNHLVPVNMIGQMTIKRGDLIDIALP